MKKLRFVKMWPSVLILISKQRINCTFPYFACIQIYIYLIKKSAEGQTLSLLISPNPIFQNIKPNFIINDPKGVSFSALLNKRNIYIFVYMQNKGKVQFILCSLFKMNTEGHILSWVKLD